LHELKVYDQRMALSKEQIQHLAKLARIEITEDEIQQLASQLSDILVHFEALEEVNTDDVIPTAHPAPLRNIMRSDEIGASLTREEVLELAPETENGLIRVKAVLE
jgi:aspartyl-tRNA(Asn)/glutamyl-tRNA(Gln) amidotransferase subunit C